MNRRERIQVTLEIVAAIALGVLLILTAPGCALQGGTIDLSKPQTPRPVPIVNFALSLDVRDALVVLQREDDQSTQTIQTAPGRYNVATGGVRADVPPIQASVVVTAPGYVVYREPLKFVQPDGFCKVGPIPASGDYELCDVTLHLAFPPVPTRDQVLSGHLKFAGLSCDTKDFGVIPWFDPSLFSLSEAGRESVYACKHAAGDTEAFILFDDVHGSIYNENDGNVVYPMQSRHFETDLDGFRAAVIEVLRHGFTPKIYLGGDGDFGWLIAEPEFPFAHDALLHAGPNGEDLNAYVKYSPGWDSVFYGWEPPTHLTDFGRWVRSICPACYLTFEINPGHLPQEAELDMSDFDGIDLEFAADIHTNNTWGILERLIGPAYIRPADDAPPLDSDPPDPHPRPWLNTNTPRGHFYTNCFEFGFDTYDWVRWRISEAEVQAHRDYLRSIGCGAPGVPLN